MKRIHAVLIALALILLAASQGDIQFVDEYLARWDRFAQGENSLAPGLEHDLPRFSSELSRLVREGDPRAPARAVFYVVVQVGGSIPVDSELGTALEPVLGRGFPIVESQGNPPVFFCADLYFWWLKNRSRYKAFPLFDDWLQRDFARDTVIPMYEKVRSKPVEP